MAEIQSSLSVRDGAVKISVEFRIWRAKDGNSLIVLDPQDRRSHEFVQREAKRINTILSTKFDLREPAVYERDFEDGSFVPQKGSKSYFNGMPMLGFEADELGRLIENNKAPKPDGGIEPCR